MRNFSIAFIAIMLSATAHAAVAPQFQDIKLPTQQMVEMQAFGAPVAASSSLVLLNAVGPTSAAAATITSFTGQPDVPRNLVITPGGSTAHVLPCVVTVAGLNFHYRPVSEDFTFASAASTAQTGLRAFRSVTSISFPANCEASPFDATWSVGVGEKIGLKYCMASSGDWLQSSRAGVHESTLATITSDPTALSLNTADFNGTMDGVNSFTGYFFQNFRCKP